MTHDTTFRHGHFAARDALKDGHAFLLEFVSLHIDQVGAGQPMLGNEDRLPVALDIREEFGSLPLEGRDEFGAHAVTLKYHLLARKHQEGNTAT